MDLEKYIRMENVKIPQTMKDLLSKKGGITKIEFDDKNDILKDKNMQKECGYEIMSDGHYLVSMCVPMPNVTKEMVEWWFWWHAQEHDRYKAWYPGEHIATGFDKKDKEYFNSKTVPPFKTVTHYPVERIGKLCAPLSIEFVTPTEFGFSQDIMLENDVEHIVCGHVGAFKGLVPNTEMAHILVNTENGAMWVSRFWLGKRVKSKILRKLFVTEKQAKGMAEHCYVEYHNFAIRIPQMYHEWLEE